MPFTQTYAQEANNQVKLNLLPLTGGTFAVEYERALIGGLTAVGMFSYRAESNLPFLSSWKSLVDDEETENILADTKMGATSFAVEARYYPSKKGAMRGFYVGPYLKHATYSSFVPLSVEFNPGEQTGYEEIEKVDLSGKINALSFGLGIGVQFKLAKNVSLDWRIIGPGYGSSRGTLTGKADRALTPDEQQELRDQLDDIGEIPFVKIKSSNVDAEGADVKIKGPWAGIRTGLSIGYRF
jgi:hypothetical protein